MHARRYTRFNGSGDTLGGVLKAQRKLWYNPKEEVLEMEDDDRAVAGVGRKPNHLLRVADPAAMDDGLRTIAALAVRLPGTS
jgi:hypothetical protein